MEKTKNTTGWNLGVRVQRGVFSNVSLERGRVQRGGFSNVSLEPQVWNV